MPNHCQYCYLLAKAIFSAFYDFYVLFEICCLCLVLRPASHWWCLGCISKQLESYWLIDALIVICSISKYVFLGGEDQDCWGSTPSTGSSAQAPFDPNAGEYSSFWCTRSAWRPVRLSKQITSCFCIRTGCGARSGCMGGMGMGAPTSGCGCMGGPAMGAMSGGCMGGMGNMGGMGPMGGMGGMGMQPMGQQPMGGMGGMGMQPMSQSMGYGMGCMGVQGAGNMSGMGMAAGNAGAANMSIAERQVLLRTSLNMLPCEALWQSRPAVVGRRVSLRLISERTICFQILVKSNLLFTRCMIWVCALNMEIYFRAIFKAAQPAWGPAANASGSKARRKRFADHLASLGLLKEIVSISWRLSTIATKGSILLLLFICFPLQHLMLQTPFADLPICIPCELAGRWSHVENNGRSRGLRESTKVNIASLLLPNYSSSWSHCHHHVVMDIFFGNSLFWTFFDSSSLVLVRSFGALETLSLEPMRWQISPWSNGRMGFPDFSTLTVDGLAATLGTKDGLHLKHSLMISSVDPCQLGHHFSDIFSSVLLVLLSFPMIPVGSFRQTCFQSWHSFPWGLLEHRQLFKAQGPGQPGPEDPRLWCHLCPATFLNDDICIYLQYVGRFFEKSPFKHKPLVRYRVVRRKHLVQLWQCLSSAHWIEFCTGKSSKVKADLKSRIKSCQIDTTNY